ncbi:AIPR family protein [Paraglaciecola aquimarina]|uniref:AIPR family protein n=1 Tax=Paraglaciecola algarum TaxID=3050085 RepID=A0ABS9DBJ0_9ALTE|nr:AIPR family protein [Paraglaciecola sp. G1-23]MCF2950326.1 AIPR family protein [Paraglaciecola sp. G1-23]
MANINDFKILNLKCRKYYKLLEDTVELEEKAESEVQKSRLGFYIFMLESLCGVKEIEDLASLITDTDFNKYLNGTTDEDFGIDAVYIDDDEKQINLFNFKYREKFKANNHQSLNETILSTKYVNAIINEDTTEMNGKPKKFADEVIEKLNSNDVWKFNLYVVSNESVEISTDEFNIKQLKQLYDLELIPIGLPFIADILSIRPEPIKASLILEPEALMSYTEHSLSSSKSYIARLTSSEVVRITCNDQVLRNKYNIEDLGPIASVNLDFGSLFDNVRGFVVKSKYNQNIEKSLKEAPSKFFMYNNGITIVAKTIKTTPFNANKKLKLEIDDFQILNGGQTVRSIHNFNSKDALNISEYLSKSEILVRIFVTDSDDNSVNKIAEYTNSQNTISATDLKSLSSEQIAIEQFLEEHDIIYARKTGDTGRSDNKIYKYKISMERFGQLLLALKGFPEKSSNQKQHIFGKYYTDLFDSQSFDVSEAPTIIETYFNVISEYSNLKAKYIPLEQKFFYIMHINKFNSGMSINEQITFLEDAIKEFTPMGKTTTDARKMIQVGFRETIDKKLTSLMSD